MLWQELTAPEFAKAVKEVGGVCLLSIGCLERHSEHLPLGTDFLVGFDICRLAAEKEPAIVFPPYYFGQIHEARCFPGTVAMGPVRTLELLMEICAEIARNGLNKIVLFNAHGGNKHLLGYLIETHLSSRKPYSIYLPGRLSEGRRKQWDALMTTPYDYHAGQSETSISLAIHEHLVKMDKIIDNGQPQNRYARLPESFVTHGWYADYPNHYAGDARTASREKGLQFRQLLVDSLAEYVQAVKDDTAVAAVAQEFYDRCDRVGQ